jgi:hypothetical protein
MCNQLWNVEGLSGEDELGKVTRIRRFKFDLAGNPINEDNMGKHDDDSSDEELDEFEDEEDNDYPDDEDLWGEDDD